MILIHLHFIMYYLSLWKQYDTIGLQAIFTKHTFKVWTQFPMYFGCCDYDPWDSSVHVSEGKFIMMECALVPVPVDHCHSINSVDSIALQDSQFVCLKPRTHAIPLHSKVVENGKWRFHGWVHRQQIFIFHSNNEFNNNEFNNTINL